MAGPGATVVFNTLPGLVSQERRSGIKDMHAMPSPTKERVFAVEQIHSYVLGMRNLFAVGAFEFDSDYLHYAIHQLAPLNVAQFVHDS